MLKYNYIIFSPAHPDSSAIKEDRKAVAVILHDSHSALILNKAGNRREVQIAYFEPAKVDLETLEEMQGKLVEYTDQKDVTEKMWLWWWYNDCENEGADFIELNLIALEV